MALLRDDRSFRVEHAKLNHTLAQIDSNVVLGKANGRLFLSVFAEDIRKDAIGCPAVPSGPDLPGLVGGDPRIPHELHDFGREFRLGTTGTRICFHLGNPHLYPALANAIHTNP